MFTISTITEGAIMQRRLMKMAAVAGISIIALTGCGLEQTGPHAGPTHLEQHQDTLVAVY